MKLLNAVLGFLATTVMGKPSADLVTSLPEMETFSYGVYSGYIELGTTTKNLHYILTESQNNWATDPLIIWFNGGPGCSSVLGWATENGPWVMDTQSTSFRKNDYAWNLNANVLYIEQPAGVGYSYADCKTAPRDCVFNDTTTGVDNLDFMNAWLAKFPEYAATPLWISGESYAGIYGPTFAYHIVEYNKEATIKINLQGFAIGDGCTNWTYDTMPATLNMTYGHALFNTELWDKMTDNFCDYSGIEFNQPPSTACMGYLTEFNELIADIDLYQIYLGQDGTPANGMCSAQENEIYKQAMKFGLAEDFERRPYKKHQFTGDYAPWHNTVAKAQARKNGDKVHSCLGGDPLTSYLNNALVKEALHISESSSPW